MRRVVSIVWRELVVRWNLERSHVALAIGYGVYLQRAQTFSGPGVAFRAMDRVAHAVVPSLDGETAWGALMVLAGALTLEGCLSGNAWVRRTAALYLSGLWLTMRTNRDGSLLKRGNLATFANRKHKLVHDVHYAGGKQYTIHVPARAPFGHGVADNQEVFEREIERALLDEMQGGAIP